MKHLLLLNEFGEKLYSLYCDPNYESFALPKYNSIIGTHHLCGGNFRIKEISEEFNALCCNECNLRIVIPKEVNTYGKLRDWCNNMINSGKQQKIEDFCGVVI